MKEEEEEENEGMSYTVGRVRVVINNHPAWVGNHMVQPGSTLQPQVLEPSHPIGTHQPASKLEPHVVEPSIPTPDPVPVPAPAPAPAPCAAATAKAPPAAAPAVTACRNLSRGHDRAVQPRNHLNEHGSRRQRHETHHLAGGSLRIS